MNENDIVIVAAKRTPIGNLLGVLSTLTAPELGAIAHRAALLQCGLPPHEISEVISGCVLQAGIGQAPARQAAIKAGIPYASGATTINKMCGSGMKAVMFAHDTIKVDPTAIILAGGMESMSNAPYLLAKVRKGLRIGHGVLSDHMYIDGLEDVYDKGQLMGCFAEDTAQQFQFTRENLDDYARTSLTRALKAQTEHAFDQEIAPVQFFDGKVEVNVCLDEGPDPKKLEKIARLRPAFQEGGVITAANSSSISDGAASLILMTLAQAQRLNITPLARIVAHASHADAPNQFTTAPISAINNVLKKAKWSQSDVDLYEINEAFAVVSMAAIHELALPAEQVNIHGGACALGHPIGASGARIIITLLYALARQHKKRGVASLCIGGGEATAVAIELI